jgi:hypothetical protein
MQIASFAICRVPFVDYPVVEGELVIVIVINLSTLHISILLHIDSEERMVLPGGRQAKY